MAQAPQDPLPGNGSGHSEDQFHFGAEAFSTLINLAGRQRMLSQRMILHLLLAVQGHQSAMTIAQEAFDLFQRSHESLCSGAARETLRDILDGSRQADQEIRRFIARTTAAMSAVSSRQGTADRLLAALVEQASPVLELLNGLTQHCEEKARAQAMAQRKRQHSMMDQIQRIAAEARIVSLNARVAAAHAGLHGREFSVIAGVLLNISEQIERIAKSARAVI